MAIFADKIHNSVPMSNDFKRIPYGISDFKQVLEENKYLVDKTMFFEKMELAGNFLFLVRPIVCRTLCSRSSYGIPQQIPGDAPRLLTCG